MSLDGTTFLERFGRIDYAAQIIRKIIDALIREEYAEALTRAAQSGMNGLRLEVVATINHLRKDLNPAQPRDPKGRWTEVGSEHVADHAQTEAVVNSF